MQSIVIGKSSRTLLRVSAQVSLCGSTWSCLIILGYLTNITSRRPTKINYRSTIDAILHNLADRRFPAHKVLRKSRKIAKARRSKQKIILKCKSLGLESHPSHRTIIILSVLVSPRFLAVQLFIFCFAAFSSPPSPEKRAVCDSDARRFAWSQKRFKSKIRIEYCKYFIIVDAANAKYRREREWIWLIPNLTPKALALTHKKWISFRFQFQMATFSIGFALKPSNPLIFWFFGADNPFSFTVLAVCATDNANNVKQTARGK